MNNRKNPFGKKNPEKKELEKSLLKCKDKNSKKDGKRPNKKHGVLRIPSRLERLIEEYIEYKTGNPVNSPVILERIRQSIQAQKAGYWDTDPYAKYGRGYDVFAYLAYQAPVYLIQFKHLMKLLDTKGILPKDISILDLGTGPGIVPLAAIWYQKERKSGSLHIHAVEKSEEFLEAFRFLIPEFIKGSSSVSTGTIQTCDIQNQDCVIPGNFSIISCQNVLAEMSHLSIPEKASMLKKYYSHLSDDGLLVIIEPAELRHSTELRKLQKFLEQCGLFVFAPCQQCRTGTCDYKSCWSFDELLPMSPTKLMTALAGEKEGYRYNNTDIKFSYSIFTKKKKTAALPERSFKDTIPLDELEDYLGEWVSVIGAKMSQDLGNREFSVFLICDGASYKKTYLIIPRSLHTQDISYTYNSVYGEILKIQNVRVRWNEKKNAYNLISGKRTRVSTMNK